MKATRPNWIAGTLELSSKVRYGLTSRGVPLFRFVPYDRKLGPFAVGCSSRNLFYNVHAIIEPEQRSPLVPPPSGGELPRGLLVQLLGQPTPESEQTVLLTSYAFDSQKELRHEHKLSPQTPLVDLTNRGRPIGFTFHIDPPGCRDVDDAITVHKHEDKNLWDIWIHIADVSTWVDEGSEVDSMAKAKATTFYSPTGQALAPMLPRDLSEGFASLLPSTEEKPAVSLYFTWNSKTRECSTFTLRETAIRCDRSFTYDEATQNVDNFPELAVLADISDSENSHVWVEHLMILYNTFTGIQLKKSKGAGLLRRHSAKRSEAIKTLPPELYFLAYESAEHCLTTEEETKHFGLEREAYAYATSPLRRYADLVNQRALHSLIYEKQLPVTSLELVEHLNRREKQAKAFSRDLFFSTALASSNEGVEGQILSFDNEKKIHKVYVPAWKRIIKVKHLLKEPFHINQQVNITWYEDRTKASWMEKICFSIQNKE